MRGPAAVVTTLLVASACSTNTGKSPALTAPERAPVFRLAVRASTDSAVKLATFALGSIPGAIQQPRVQGPIVIVATRYNRDRRNGGYTEITLITAIDRTLRDSLTVFELSAWGMDVPPQRTSLAPSGGRLPTLSTTSPTTVSESQQQRYRITRDDAEHWRSVLEVLETFIEQGAVLFQTASSAPPRSPN